MKIQINKHFDQGELTKLLTNAYDNLHPEDSIKFSVDQQQLLNEWFEISRLKDFTGNNDGVLIEARGNSGGLIGIAYVGKENILSWPDGNKAELYLLAVSPKFRGQGFGQALIKESEKVAKDMGAKKMIIHTHINMEADQRLYRDKMGYTPMGILKGYYANGDAIFFGKDLNV